MRLASIDAAAVLLGENHPVVIALRQITNQTVPGSSGATVTIVWSPSGHGDAKTWGEVMSLVAIAAGRSCPVRIVTPDQSLDPNPVYQVPSGLYSFPFGSVLEAPVPGDASNCVIACEDGTTFENLFAVSNALKLRVRNTVLPVLAYAAPWLPVFIQKDGAQIEIGTADAYRTGSSPTNVFGFSQSNSGPVSTLGGAFVRANANAILITTFINSARIPPGSIVSDDGTANWVLQHNGCIPRIDLAADFPGWLGTYQNFSMTQLGSAGPTASRPTTVFGPIMVGAIFENTQLGYSETALDSAGTNWRMQVGQTAFFGAQTLNDLAVGTYSLQVGFTEGPSFAGLGRGGFLVATKQNLTKLVARIRQGNPPNAGRTVDIALYVNGVIVPGSTITLAADSVNPVVGTSEFKIEVNPTDLVEVGVTISGAPLPNDIFDIQGTVV